MAHAMDVSTVQSIDREITKAIRRLAWLQARRDEMAGVSGHGPRGPKGPTPTGKIKLERRPLRPSEQAIVDACQTYPEERWSTQDILDATSLKTTTVRCEITRLVRSGYLHRVGEGWYMLNPKLRHD